MSSARHHSLGSLLVASFSDEQLIDQFYEVQGRLIIEKALATSISQTLSAIIILNANTDAFKKSAFLAFVVFVNTVLLKYFPSTRQYAHDLMLSELYNRYLKLTHAGPESTWNPKATAILAAIHAELSINQMEPWRDSQEKTDYSRVSHIYLQIIALAPHNIKRPTEAQEAKPSEPESYNAPRPTISSPAKNYTLRLLDHAACNLVYATSPMRKVKEPECKQLKKA